MSTIRRCPGGARRVARCAQAAVSALTCIALGACATPGGQRTPTAHSAASPPAATSTVTATPRATAVDPGRAATSAAATAAALASATVSALRAAASEIFRDGFVDNRNAWFTGVFQEVERNTIEEGVFKVSWTGKGSSYELYELRELRDFIAEVDCRVYRGGGDGSCGLIFARQPDASFYKFELFEDYYRLYLVMAGETPALLAEGNPGASVRPGETNRLRVIRHGATISSYVNEQLLATVQDATLGGGKVGLATDSYAAEGGVELWLDNFVIWELPA